MTMKVIDVDCHVIEDASVWTHLAQADEAFRPSILRKESGATIATHFSGPNTREYWVIDDHLYGKHDAAAIAKYSNGEMSLSALTLESVAARLSEMDGQGVDMQVIFSSLFLNVRCARPAAELALTRAYNRWIAARCAESNGRLRWVFVPSLKNPHETARDMRWARDHGAVGVLFRGLEGDRFIDHRDFDPVFAAAIDLAMPICVHIGHGSPAMETITQREGATFNRFISDSPNYYAFSVLLNSKLHEAFPALRVGFFESGCTWVPAAVQTALHLRLKPAALRARVREVVAEHDLFFTCELHEDLPHLAACIGEDRLLLASDYGHPGDVADTIHHVRTVTQGKLVDDALRGKILSENALRFLSL